jgi:hypothetical protein
VHLGNFLFFASFLSWSTNCARDQFIPCSTTANKSRYAFQVVPTEFSVRRIAIVYALSAQTGKSFFDKSAASPIRGFGAFMDDCVSAQRLLSPLNETDPKTQGQKKPATISCGPPVPAG